MQEDTSNALGSEPIARPQLDCMDFYTDLPPTYLNPGSERPNLMLEDATPGDPNGPQAAQSGPQSAQMDPRDPPDSRTFSLSPGAPFGRASLGSPRVQQVVAGAPDTPPDILRAALGEGGLTLSTSGVWPTPGTSAGANEHSPFCGDFGVGSWNAQALLATRSRSQFHKKTICSRSYKRTRCHMLSRNTCPGRKCSCLQPPPQHLCCLVSWHHKTGWDRFCPAAFFSGTV